MNWKPMKIAKSGHKKVRLLNEKKKENRKTIWEIFEHKSVKFKRKLDNMNQVMDILNLNKSNLLKKKVEELG